MSRSPVEAPGRYKDPRVVKMQGGKPTQVLMLQPSQIMYLPQTKLERVFLGLGCKGKGPAIDLDCSCLGLSKGQLISNK